MKIKIRIYITLILGIVCSGLIFGQLDSGYVQLKNFDLFYRIWGEGEPIVFLNGGPGFSSRGYEKYAEALSDEYKVILFDQKGTGKSKFHKPRKHQNLSFFLMVKDLEALRAHLGLDKWIVFGHSFGGQYAANYAAKYPDSITKMILSSSQYPIIKVGYKHLQKTKHGIYYDELTDLEKEIYHLLLDEMQKKNPSEVLISKYRSALQARKYIYDLRNIDEVTSWFMNHSSEFDVILRSNEGTNRVLISKLKKFNKPVLIIHGMSDFIDFTHPKRNHELYSNSRLEMIENSGHMILLDQPEKYVSSIKNFLKK